MGKKIFISIILPVILAGIVYGAFWVYGEIRHIPKECSAEEIYALAAPSVVEINGTSYKGDRTGTGFFYDKEGTVITNYHVIEGCTSATIKTYDGEVYDVISVLGYDEGGDIAVLDTRCKVSKPLPFRAGDIKTGEIVYAIGSSLGLTGSLSNGIISTAARVVEGNSYIQTTAPISEGNSGGPLIDKYGYILGITTASFVEGQNLNLAVPITRLNNVLKIGPIELSKLFKPVVHWIFDYDFLYYDKADKYVLFFQIGDEEYIPITSSGSARIVITNNDGVVVYRETLRFDESDYSTWTLRGVEDKTLVALYIDPKDIAKGSTPYGTVTTLVFSDEYSFEALTLNTYELPTK